MSPSAYSVHWAFSALVVVLLMAPLVDAVHHHEVDHDGRVLHVETDHGGHFHTIQELDERVTSSGPATPTVPTATWSHPESLPVRVLAPISVTVEHPPRPPPPPLSPRPPPQNS